MFEAALLGLLCQPELVRLQEHLGSGELQILLFPMPSIGAVHTPVNFTHISYSDRHVIAAILGLLKYNFEPSNLRNTVHTLSSHLHHPSIPRIEVDLPTSNTT